MAERGRRLLVATIGAASVQFATACEGGENIGTFVANLMAAPFVPPPGAAGEGGAAGAGADLDAGADDDAGRD
jgi:hypothetical protein